MKISDNFIQKSWRTKKKKICSLYNWIWPKCISNEILRGGKFQQCKRLIYNPTVSGCANGRHGDLQMTPKLLICIVLIGLAIKKKNAYFPASWAKFPSSSADFPPVWDGFPYVFLYFFPPNHKISWQGTSCFACFFFFLLFFPRYDNKVKMGSFGRNYSSYFYWISKYYDLQVSEL